MWHGVTVGALLSIVAVPSFAGSDTGSHVTLDLPAPRAAEVAHELERLGDEPLNASLGSIEIPRVGVYGPIVSGVDDVTIRRAVGHFPESALPFQPGNMALAAHRTTHFRGLRDIRVGDDIRIRTPTGDLAYVVEQTWVVSPQDVWVVDPTTERALTLVTCFPFDFPGRAPQRFVVRARAVTELAGSAAPAASDLTALVTAPGAL